MLRSAALLAAALAAAFAAAAGVSGFFGEVESSPPLLMQVEWVLQGYEISFTGFLCELLGIAAALRDQLPLLIVLRSSFKTGTSLASGGELPQAFVRDLFSKEQKSLLYLTQRSAPNSSHIAAAKPPTTKFGPGLAALPDSCNPTQFEVGYQFVGGDMTRYDAGRLTAAAQCCGACLANPLCLSWTHDSSSHQCHLKASAELEKMSTSLPSDFSGAIAGRKLTAPRAIIFHGTTCIHQNQSFAGGGGGRRDINTLLIGRLMVERASFSGGLDLNEYAVISCASVVDVVWVPTQWHVGVFNNLLAMASVTGKRIRVVPEAVDTELFDPALVSAEAQETRRLRGSVRHCELRRSEAIVPGSGDQLLDASSWQRLVCPGETRFEFLSVFKWERRKGWDILLRAYFRAFGPRDDVRLRLRTYVPSFLGGDLNITSRIEEFAFAATGSTLKQLPEVVWERGADEAERENGMSREEVRDLYFLADCFVLPTRGEGWGLPVAEAMAMGLPVIVTNYSGPAAYATEGNAYPLPVLLEFDHEHYAVPDEDALVLLLRQVVSDSLSSTSSSGSGSGSGSRSDGETQAQVEARRRGQRARETMQRNFSATHVAEIMKQRLRQEVSARGWEA